MIGGIIAILIALWVLCRPRHKTHYADARIMPIWVCKLLFQEDIVENRAA